MEDLIALPFASSGFGSLDSSGDCSLEKVETEEILFFGAALIPCDP